MNAATRSVTGVLNFAADRNDGGRISTFTGEEAQNLLAVEVEIHDIRALGRKTSLAEEGFVIASHPVTAPKWDDKEWVDAVYVPSCLDLVKRLTGTARALNMYDPIKRTRRPDGTVAAAASFIHWDQPREQYVEAARKVAAAQGVDFERAAIFNVWKSMTPPPQDLPLALADRRSVLEADQVMATSFGFYGEALHIKLAHSEQGARWFYVPDLAISESIVFLSADFDPDQPLGCPHSAFHAPGQENLVPRASIEVRVLACFD